MILSSDKIEDIISILYAKDYPLFLIKQYYRGVYKDSVLVIGQDNDDLRKDLIFILNLFHEDYGIIKYLDEVEAKKVFSDGSEKNLEVVMYNSNTDNVSYIYNGISFSFLEKDRYWKPSKKEDFKIGMLVEYLNNNKWYSKRVEDPNYEYDKIYKLLIKYDKIRIKSTI
jgi:hypothetical protein